MKNYIFYHCTPINDYYERFVKTFNKIKKSNLLSKIEKIFVCLNGESENNFQLDDKIEILKISNRHPNESVTINYIRNFCKENKGSKILYLHSKGITKPPHEIENVNAWIDFMEYFLIERHGQCLKDLSDPQKSETSYHYYNPAESYDAVGVNFKPNPKHFSGNFWWANGDYIASLDECANEYYAPEMWHLSKCPENKIKSYFNTDKNLYHEKIYKKEYKMNINEIKNYILEQGSDSVHMFGGKFDGGIHLQQHPDEISEVLNFLLESGKSFNNMMEVGSASGANAKIFCEILNINDLLIIDNNEHSKHVVRPENLKNIKYQEFIGNSQGEDAHNWAKSFNKKFDIIYIDADHSYEGVVNDIENYISFLADDGYMIFHDSLACDGVVKALNEFHGSKLKEEFSSKIKFGITISSKI